MSRRRPRDDDEVSQLSGSTSAGTVKIRKTASKAEGQMIERAGVQQSQEDFETELKLLEKDLRAHPALLKSCRGLVAKHTKLQKPLQMRPGVRHMKDVPEKMLRPALTAVHRVDDIIFSAMEFEDMQKLGYLTVDAEDKMLRLPYIEMYLEQFIAWMEMRYNNAGRPLRRVRWTQNMQFNWELLWGKYRYVLPKQPTEMRDDDEIEVIERKRDKKIAKLPRGFTCLFSEVTSTWTIAENYSEKDAALKNIKTNASYPLWSLFNPEET